MTTSAIAGRAMDVDELARCLGAADLRVLLLTLHQMTGDEIWLSDRYRPRRDVKLIADEDAGLPQQVQAEIRAAALRVLSDPPDVPAFTDPGDARMHRLMSWCLGEAVPPEYAPMMAEEIGFRPRQVQWSESVAPRQLPQAPVIIVGAGASGIALGANLVALGIDFVILEKNPEVGGTWWENRYPGCAVDTPNHAYSFSFGERYPWSRCFSPRDEILDYMQRSADAFGVRPRVRPGCEVTACSWQEQSRRWRVEFIDEQGEQAHLDGCALVSGVGIFNIPKVARFPGDDQFAGPLFHTAHWPEDLEPGGKRVAVIGTGASAMQIVPSIAPQVAQLTVFQRSAQWARPIPRFHDAISAEAQALLQRFPIYASWFRFCMFWRYGDGLLPSLRKDPAWPHPERSINRHNDRHRQQMTDHMLAELQGREDLIEQCLPSYPPYGKRILLDNDWFTTLRRDNVELVTTDIAGFTGDGISTADGVERRFDVIVLSTGFEAEVLAARLNVTGRDGTRLVDAWDGDDPRAYLGLAVPGFPNFFTMLGPNTGLGHGGSAIFVAECQARYITGVLVAMIEQGLAQVDVRPEVERAWTERVDAEHEQMIWTHPGMSTYYRNSRGRVIGPMPWRLVDYWRATHAPDLADYATTS